MDLYVFIFFNRAEALIGSGGKRISLISLNSHDRGNYKDSVSINIYDRVEALKRVEWKIKHYFY